VARKARRTNRSNNMKRVLPIVLLVSAVAITVGAPPARKPQDYTAWNDKWFATNQGESFIVAVEVGNPRGGGAHSFRATFLPGGGMCQKGVDAPKERVVFLNGTMSNGKISGKIFLCTTSQELVDKNQVPAVFTRDFQASYDPAQASIMDATYKSEHYQREYSDTHGGSHSEPSQTPGAYQRDEPGDPTYGFEMHLYRPGYDQVTHNETNPGPGSTPPKLGQQAEDKLNDVVGRGTHDWLNWLREHVYGADPI